MLFAALDVLRGTTVARIAAWAWRVPGVLARRSERDDRSVRALSALSPGEKALLRRFLEGDTRTIHVSHPAAAFGLELAEIVTIHRDPARARSGEPFGLVLHAWALDHLRRHPELLVTSGR
jgi:hypothetical protein